MAKPLNNKLDVGTPREYPSSTPSQDLYATSDIRFVTLEIGKLVSTVNRLCEDVKEQSQKISEISKKAATLETTIKVGGGLIAIFLVGAWWLIGDHVKSAVNSAIRTTYTAPHNGSSVTSDIKSTEPIR